MFYAFILPLLGDILFSYTNIMPPSGDVSFSYTLEWVEKNECIFFGPSV